MNSKYLHHALLYMCFYCFWGFIFTHTVLLPSSSVYPAFLFLLIIFAIAFASGKSQMLNNSRCNIWFPFLILTLVSYLFSMNLENVVYRVVCILLLLSAYRYDFINSIPKKFVIFCGIITITGIFIQIFLPIFYYSHINNLFLNYEDVIQWADSRYGFAGFNYQLSHTANSLIIAEGMCLYLFYEIFHDSHINKCFYWILVSLLMVCLLLTGKRIFAVMSFGLPLAVHILSKKQSSRIVFSALFAIFLGYIGISYFIDNSGSYENSLLLGRFSHTVSDMQTGGNWSSDREELGGEAIALFNQNPLTGVGVGKFHTLSKEHTDVHNSYLQVLCEQGLIGFILFIVPLIVVLKKTISFIEVANYDDTSFKFLKFSLFVQLYFIFYGFTGNVTVDPGNFLMYFLAVAIFYNIKTITCSRV